MLGCVGDAVLKRLLLAGGVTLALGCTASAATWPSLPDRAAMPRWPRRRPILITIGRESILGPNLGAAWASLNNAATTDAITGAAVGSTTPSGVWNWGIAGGGQIGANLFFAPNFIVGAEADFDALSNKGTVSFADGSTQAGKTEFVSTARARIGLTADRFLWYVTGGFAWAQN